MTFNYKYNYPQVARDSGFKLRNYKDGPLDWRLMGSLEVERILRDQSLEQIDSVLSHLSEAPLGSILESNILDSGIAKYFILSQFSVQYLLFCRKFLEETVADLRESNGESQIELSTLKRSLSEANNEILQLHKKITQMEAIHEVIYPCHLCTKNFVSNDALNLHISRKHSGIISKTEKRSETPPAAAKERENDLTLINTIKLELEIKQLKERLNTAEREIKEGNLAPSRRSTSKEQNDGDKFEKLSVQSIGIQSNLSEIKEKDDNSEDDTSNSSQNRDKLCLLQEKLKEFDLWKEEQKNQNTEFLTEINKKLQDLSAALEMTKNQREQKFDNENLRSLPSVEDLEILLSKKVEDIGKASADKLEDVVSKMEMAYRGKIEELEKAMKKICEKSIIPKERKSSEVYSSKDEYVKKKIKSNDDTFEIVKIKESIPKETFVNDEKVREDKEYFQRREAMILKDKTSSDSNHTFVKDKIMDHIKGEDDHNQVSSSEADDCTDVSDSLQEEEIEITKIENKIKTLTPINDIHPIVKKQFKPKIVTRKEAKKLTNSRMATLGVEMKTKFLTQASKKRISEELSEKRNRLKQKHPNFYATRNKIKKFVDKLCSSKMPTNAEALLKVTKPLKPKNIPIKSKDSEYSSSNEEENESIKTSTPLNETVPVSNTDFKQRLERILASPIRKPEEHHIKAVIHQQQAYVAQKPVPMPRKRVMFNQPEIREKRFDESLSLTESDESILQK